MCYMYMYKLDDSRQNYCNTCRGDYCCLPALKYALCPLPPSDYPVTCFMFGLANLNQALCQIIMSIIISYLECLYVMPLMRYAMIMM